MTIQADSQVSSLLDETQTQPQTQPQTHSSKYTNHTYYTANKYNNIKFLTSDVVVTSTWDTPGKNGIQLWDLDRRGEMSVIEWTQLGQYKIKSRMKKPFKNDVLICPDLKINCLDVLECGYNSLIVSGSNDGVIRTHRATEILETTEFANFDKSHLHVDGVNCIASGYGKQVVSGGEDGVISIHNIETGESFFNSRKDCGGITIVKMLQENVCAGAGFGGKIELYDVRSRHGSNTNAHLPIKTLANQNSSSLVTQANCASVCEFNPNYIAVGYNTGSFSVWDIRGGEESPLHQVTIDSSVNDICFDKGSNNGVYFATGTRVYKSNPKQTNILKLVYNAYLPIKSIDYSSAFQSLAVASDANLAIIDCV